ncbi:MAG: hypothetical protein ACOVQX_05115 [Legionella sp.]
MSRKRSQDDLYFDEGGAKRSLTHWKLANQWKRDFGILPDELESEPTYNEEGYVKHPRYWYSAIMQSNLGLRQMAQKKEIPLILTNDMPPFWQRLLLQPYNWLPFNEDITDKEFPQRMNPQYAALILNKLKTTKINKKTLFNWAMSNSAKNKQKGDLGEFFVHTILTTELGPIKTFNNKISFPALKEDGDPIDISFKYDNIYVHVCVKASADKMNTLASSPSFYYKTDNDLRLPYKTIIVRVRINELDLDNPMGPQCSLYMAVMRNFDVIS